jgi:hypothetical protein
MKKRCPSCGEEKTASLLEFTKNAGSPDGLSCYCKGCSRKKRMEYYYKNRELSIQKVLEYQRRNKKRYNEYQKKQHREWIEECNASYLYQLAKKRKGITEITDVVLEKIAAELKEKRARWKK